MLLQIDAWSYRIRSCVNISKCWLHPQHPCSVTRATDLIKEGKKRRTMSMVSDKSSKLGKMTFTQIKSCKHRYQLISATHRISPAITGVPRFNLYHQIMRTFFSPTFDLPENVFVWPLKWLLWNLSFSSTCSWLETPGSQGESAVLRIVGGA